MAGFSVVVLPVFNPHIVRRRGHDQINGIVRKALHSLQTIHNLENIVGMAHGGLACRCPCPQQVYRTKLEIFIKKGKVAEPGKNYQGPFAFLSHLKRNFFPWRLITRLPVAVKPVHKQIASLTCHSRPSGIGGYPHPAAHNISPTML